MKYFALRATYFGIYSRHAVVRNRTPMTLYNLTNARSGDLHFGTPFVALPALVREIISNAIHTYMPTYILVPKFGYDGGSGVNYPVDLRPQECARCRERRAPVTPLCRAGTLTTPPAAARPSTTAAVTAT